MNKDNKKNFKSENIIPETKPTIDELLNEIKQQHGNCNLFKRTSVRPNGEFIIFNNESLRLKDKNGKLLKDNLIGHFVRYYALAYNWNLNQRGISTITGTCVDTVGKYDEELRKLGYLETYQPRYSDGTFAPTINIINETANNELWIKDSLPAEIQYLIDNYPEFKKTVRNLSDSASPDSDLPNTENTDQYKNTCINRIQIKDRRDLISKQVNPKNESSSKSSSSSSSTSLNVSLTESFSTNTEDICNMNTCLSSNKHTLNEAENSAAKPKGKVGRKTKVDKLKEEFQQIIKNESDDELRELLLTYFDIYIDTKRSLHLKVYEAKMQQLEEISKGNIEIKRKVVKKAITDGVTYFNENWDYNRPDKSNSSTKSGIIEDSDGNIKLV